MHMISKCHLKVSGFLTAYEGQSRVKPGTIMLVKIQVMFIDTVPLHRPLPQSQIHYNVHIIYTVKVALYKNNFLRHIALLNFNGATSVDSL
jgi:hypothetical protein